MASKNSTPIHQDNEKKSGLHKALLSGGVAASIARTIIYPIERVEILRQVENVDYKGLNFFRSSVKFYQTQGIPGFFKGNTASVARNFPYCAIEFTSFEYFKNIFVRGNKDAGVFHTLLCGFLTGFTAITLTYPMDLARTRLAINTENSHIKESRWTVSLRGLYMREGFQGLFKGYQCAILGLFHIGIKQTTFDIFKKMNIPDKWRSSANFFFGGFSAFWGMTLLYPIYLMRRVLQSNNDRDFKAWAYLRDIYRTQGYIGYYRGYSMAIIKLVPYQGLLFYFNEKLKKLLKY